MDIESSFKSYKMKVTFKDDILTTKEWFDGQWICNSMKMDVEGPIRYPDDKEGKRKQKGRK